MDKPWRAGFVSATFPNAPSRITFLLGGHKFQSPCIYPHPVTSKRSPASIPLKRQVSICFSHRLSSCVFYGDIYPNHECFDQATSEKIKQLLIARKTFAYGPTYDYFYHRNCIGFVRLGDVEHAGCAVVMSNEAPDTEYVSTSYPQRWCLM